ncbi:MAG: hypothetical protein F6K19_06675 [Cyanothece sp. SIO1E1]|nr:hypothetical protein [Cyanothece sp. SIO1E1]
MKLPKQSQPVPRLMLHDPYPTVDLKLMESLVRKLQAEANAGNEESKLKLKDAREALLSMRFELLHSINHDDPHTFSSSTGFCGCHILAGQARLLCIAGCGQF